MIWIRRILKGAFLIWLGAVLHYYLPQRDIVQVINADVKRMDVGGFVWFWDQPDANTKENATRDVRFINTTGKNGKPKVYRNEDTNWAWPPYFKFDSADLNAKAQSIGKEDDTWVAVSHYGWRIKMFSAFPNAYKIKRVDGPNTFLIPWFNIVFLSLLLIGFLSIRRFFRNLKTKHVDPIADKIGSAADAAGDDLAEKKTAVSGFFRKWFGTSKKN
ncbi:MAG: DUF1523 family protein [Acidimicrobiales bacterium]|nr:DUF1523 family protein [Hyphomonadaceae bacterium]RZV36596.1 MAG: DUF1523 family protein [Acidimicrobiales bacterium]